MKEYDCNYVASSDVSNKNIKIYCYKNNKNQTKRRYLLICILFNRNKEYFDWKITRIKGGVLFGRPMIFITSVEKIYALGLDLPLTNPEDRSSFQPSLSKRRLNEEII